MVINFVILQITYITVYICYIYITLPLAYGILLVCFYEKLEYKSACNAFMPFLLLFILLSLFYLAVPVILFQFHKIYSLLLLHGLLFLIQFPSWIYDLIK